MTYKSIKKEDPRGPCFFFLGGGWVGGVLFDDVFVVLLGFDIVWFISGGFGSVECFIMSFLDTTGFRKRWTYGRLCLYTISLS